MRFFRLWPEILFLGKFGLKEEKNKLSAQAEIWYPG